MDPYVHRHWLVSLTCMGISVDSLNDFQTLNKRLTADEKYKHYLNARQETRAKDFQLIKLNFLINLINL